MERGGQYSTRERSIEERGGYEGFVNRRGEEQRYAGQVNKNPSWSTNDRYVIVVALGGVKLSSGQRLATE